jgi:hypothetical protein
MRSTILALLIWLVIPLTAWAQRDVVFTATENWAVISTATGKVTKSDPFLSVELDRYTMRVRSNYEWPVQVLRYKIGLATRKPNGEWNVARWSEPVELNTYLIPGQTKLIENYKTVIPIDGLESLKDYWLVLAVETNINGIVGVQYAHSNQGLF